MSAGVAQTLAAYEVDIPAEARRKRTTLSPQKHRMLARSVVEAVGVGPALRVSSSRSAFVTSGILCGKLSWTF